MIHSKKSFKLKLVRREKRNVNKINIHGKFRNLKFDQIRLFSIGKQHTQN